MLFFLFLFVAAGILLGLFITDQKIAFPVTIVISVIWFFVYGPWAVATLIELLISYKICRIFIETNDINTNRPLKNKHNNLL